MAAIGVTTEAAGSEVTGSLYVDSLEPNMIRIWSSVALVLAAVSV